jgi:hypothetical protein
MGLSDQGILLNQTEARRLTANARVLDDLRKVPTVYINKQKVTKTFAVNWALDRILDGEGLSFRVSRDRMEFFDEGFNYDWERWSMGCAS